MGFMTKGPVVFIVPVIVFPAMNSLWPSKRRGLSWHHVGGIALFFLTALPWYVFLLAENRAFLDYFVIDHTVNRFATDQFKRGEPFWFFLAVLPLFSFPWLLLSLVRLKRFFMPPFNGAHLLGLWIVVPLLFFSLSSSKLLLYILPIFPAVAVWAAHSWSQMMKKNQTRWNITLLVYHAILLAAIALAPLFVKEITDYNFAIWGMALVMGGLVVYQWFNIAKPLKSVWVAALFSLSLTILSSFFLGANPVLSNDTKDVAELVKTLLPPNGTIMVFNKRLPSMAFETQQMTLSINDGDSGLNRETQFESDHSWQRYLIEADSLLLKKDDFFVGSVLVAKKKQKENPRLQSLSQHYKKVAVVNEWQVFYDVVQ
jgi:4-amino-4-deoxy-L-arabinose transferase